MIRTRMMQRFGISLLTATVALLTGCGQGAYKVTPIAPDDRLEETVVRKGASAFAPRIAIIDIDGMLMNSRPTGLLASGENPTALVVEKINQAKEDTSVRAVILRINSPGGTVTASAIIHRHLRELAKHKPIVAYIMDVGASGGYYVACAANRIVAEPSAITGSIGVVMMTMDLSVLMSKIGVSTDAIKSGERKDAGSPFRPMKPEERQMFQGLIMEFYNDFVTVVDDARGNLTREQVLPLADGRVFSGKGAKAAGLIDEVGSFDTALSQAKSLANLRDAKVIMYHRPSGYKGTIYSEYGGPVATAANGTPMINVSLPDILTTQGNFLYLWQPNVTQ